MDNQSVSMCEHKKRAINNWLHNALEDMTQTVRQLIDDDEDGYIDDKIDEVYARNANSLQIAVHMNCKVCFPNHKENEQEKDQSLFPHQ